MRLRVFLVILSALATLSLAFRDAVSTMVAPPTEPTSPSVQFEKATETSTEETLVPPLALPSESPSFGEPSAPVATREFTLGDLATFHPHGDQVCASGCAASRHPTEELTRGHFRRLLAEYSVESIEEPGEALETLLYFGRQAAAWLERDGAVPLDPVRANLLRYELKHDYAEVSIRLVDETGDVRASLPRTRVPLDRRHEFNLQPRNLQPLIASGTVKRVGRDHLWTRL